MKFRVGKFVCELSVNEDGTVLAKWLPETPKYLNKDERAQYQAGRAAFLDQLPGTGRTGNRAETMKSHPSAFLAIAVAALLTGCARGGGIGLEAMLADHNCEQAGYQLGTPQYAACRMELGRRANANAAVMMDFYARQAEIARQNQPRMCTYNGSTIGGITSGTMSCP
jgi:hypothetical protein